MGLAKIPNDMKLEIINKLETADKLSIRQVCQSLKDVVDQTKMHYDVLAFDFHTENECLVTLFVPGGKCLSIAYTEVKEGGHTMTDRTDREQPKTVKKEGCFKEAAVKKFLDVLLKPRNSFGLVYINPGDGFLTHDVKNQEKFRKILYDGLATLNHRIPVEDISIDFDCYREVTEVIKHLVPGHLKTISGNGFYRDRVEGPYDGELEDLPPNEQIRLNALADLEQFRQAKGLCIRDELLSLPPEKTAYFTDLTCNEKELKVESLDGIIENFLRPNGWACRNLKFEEFAAIPLIEWLKKKALREFGRKLEDVVEEDHHARTITFRRGFYECSLTFWINWTTRPNREPYVHWKRLKFVNQKLMLWKDVSKRPDSITEEMVQKERERQEEVKRQDELRRAEEELKEKEKAELELNQTVRDGQSSRHPPSNNNRTHNHQHRRNQDRQDYSNRQSNRDPRNRNNRNGNYQQSRYQSNSRDYHQSYQSNQQRDRQGSVSSNQPNRRDNHYGSNQSRDGQYNRNGTRNQHYQSYQDNQWQPRRHSHNRNFSSCDQPRRYENDYHRGNHYQSACGHPSHGSSRREQGYQSYQPGQASHASSSCRYQSYPPNQNQSVRRTPDQYSRDQASHGSSSRYQSYQERNQLNQYQHSRGQSGRDHHDSYQYRHGLHSYQHNPSQNWQTSRDSNRYQPHSSRYQSNQYQSNDDSEYRRQYEPPRQDDRYQNHRDASRQHESSSYAQRR